MRLVYPKSIICRSSCEWGWLYSLVYRYIENSSKEKDVQDKKPKQAYQTSNVG